MRRHASFVVEYLTTDSQEYLIYHVCCDWSATSQVNFISLYDRVIVYQQVTSQTRISEGITWNGEFVNNLWTFWAPTMSWSLIAWVLSLRISQALHGMWWSIRSPNVSLCRPLWCVDFGYVWHMSNVLLLTLLRVEMHFIAELIKVVVLSCYTVGGGRVEKWWYEVNN